MLSAGSPGSGDRLAGLGDNIAGGLLLGSGRVYVFTKVGALSDGACIKAVLVWADAQILPQVCQ